MIRVYLILFCLSIHSLYCVNKTEGTKTSFKETKVSIISIGEGSSLADAFGQVSELLVTEMTLFLILEFTISPPQIFIQIL